MISSIIRNTMIGGVGKCRSLLLSSSSSSISLPISSSSTVHKFKSITSINDINSHYIQYKERYYSSSSSSSTSGGRDRNKSSTTSSSIQENYNIVTHFTFKVDQIVKKGDTCHRNRQYQDAVVYYENALNMTNDPIENSLIHFRIASSKFKGGLLGEAMKSFHLATRLIPYSHEETYKILSLGAFMLEFEFDIQKDKDTKESQGMLARASTAWDAVIDCAPNKPDGYVGKGRCILKMSKPQLLDAMKYSTKALSLDHNYPPVQSFSSELLVIENKEILALQLLNKFFKTYKQFYEDSFVYLINNNTIGNNYFRRGLCYLHEQLPEKAELDFTESLKYLPESEHPSIKFFRGRCYSSIKRFRDALKDFNEFIEYNPKHIPAYQERRDVYTMLGMHQLAEKDHKIVADDLEKKHEQRVESIEMYKEERLERLKRRNQDIAEKKRLLRQRKNNSKIIIISVDFNMDIQKTTTS